jgi:LAO/AO transport system kinase
MQKLSSDNRAYIRPTPASGALGGVARSTHDTIRLCESAGYDVIIVESVGVGQSEHVLTEVTDILVLVIAPGAGDELQVCILELKI